MKSFRVLIRGENFFLKTEGAVKRFGFYTTRYLEAADESEAESRVIDSLRQEGRLREIVANDLSNPPMLFAEEIIEISSLESVENRMPGLAFYEDHPNTH
jgi:hypothetical protein